MCAKTNSKARSSHFFVAKIVRGIRWNSATFFELSFAQRDVLRREKYWCILALVGISKRFSLSKEIKYSMVHEFASQRMMIFTQDRFMWPQQKALNTFHFYYKTPNTNVPPWPLTCELLQQISDPGVAAAGGAGQGRHPPRSRLEGGRPPAPRDRHHLLLSGPPRLQSWIISLNFMTRTFFTRQDLKRAISLSKTNNQFNFLKEEFLLTLEEGKPPFSCQGFHITITWLCFTMARRSSILPDKWLAMSAEWIRLSAKVLASSLRRQNLTFDKYFGLVTLWRRWGWRSCSRGRAPWPSAAAWVCSPRPASWSLALRRILKMSATDILYCSTNSLLLIVFWRSQVLHFVDRKSIGSVILQFVSWLISRNCFVICTFFLEFDFGFTFEFWRLY